MLHHLYMLSVALQHTHLVEELQLSKTNYNTYILIF